MKQQRKYQFVRTNFDNVENLYKEIARLVMSQEYKNLCRGSWKGEHYDYLYIDRPKKIVFVMIRIRKN